MNGTDLLQSHRTRPAEWSVLSCAAAAVSGYFMLESNGFSRPLSFSLNTETILYLRYVYLMDSWRSETMVIERCGVYSLQLGVYPADKCIFDR